MQNQEIFNKLKFILAKDKEDETLNDMLYKKQLKILFGVDAHNSFKLLFNEESQIGKIIYKIIDIIFLLLKIQKKEREKIYNSKVIGIKDKDKDIYKFLIELNMLQNYDLDFNNNLVDLFNIVSDYIDKKKDNASLAEYIDLILLSLSFNSGLYSFLKYQIFSLIIQLFLSKYGIVLSYKYSENEINMTEDKSIGLIMNLLNKDENDFVTMIQSIIVLNYNSLKNAIDNFSLEEILLGIADIAERLKNIKHVWKISVCAEKIIEMFVDEMEDKRNIQKSKKKKNKKSKKKKSQKKKEDITKETEITEKINEGNVSISMLKNTIEINKSVNSLNKIEEGINDKCAENALDNPKLNILNLLNNILNKIKMGNEVLKEDIDNLQNLMVNIVDGNDKLKKDVEKLTEEMQKKDLEIEKLNQENKEYKQDIKNLEERVGFFGRRLWRHERYNK